MSFTECEVRIGLYLTLLGQNVTSIGLPVLANSSGVITGFGASRTVRSGNNHTALPRKYAVKFDRTAPNYQNPLQMRFYGPRNTNSRRIYVRDPRLPSL